KHRGPGSAQRGLQAPRVHRGVGIEMDRALLRRELADRAHVFDGVHARELLVGGERRLVARDVRRHARGDELVLDRREARGLLGMMRAHLVLQALGMRDKCRRHAHAILAHPQYNRSMLLKAEFQPKNNLGSGPIQRVIQAAGGIILGKETQVRLADEVNRATPKTQSALLEAMEEHQVTAEGETRKLPTPFFVIATQNPSEQVGTFPLPESQLDRFTMRIELGYPDREAERALLAGTDRRDLLATLDPCMTPAELMELQAGVQKIHVSPALLDYVQAIVEHTRRSPDYVAGLSPRAALALV